MLKKKNANRPPAASSITPLAPASERTWKMPSRISGAGWLRSMKTNAASSAKATAASVSVVAEPQPLVSAFTIA